MPLKKVLAVPQAVSKRAARVRVLFMVLAWGWWGGQLQNPRRARVFGGIKNRGKVIFGVVDEATQAVGMLSLTMRSKRLG